MFSNIRVVEIPDEFGGHRYQLARLSYDDENYLVDVETIEQFETYASLLNFTDQVYKASIQGFVVFNPQDGTYEL